MRILDGAMATELARRNRGAPSPLALIETPELVRDIHRDYLRAGADMVTANTFRLGRGALRERGLDWRGQWLRDRAVALARQAISIERPGEGCQIAGSVGPVGDPDASADALEADHGSAIGGLVTAGVDLVLVETMPAIREAVVCARLCKLVRVPCLVAFACRDDGRLVGGETLAAAVAALAPYAPAGVLVNCTAMPAIERALASVARGTIAGCYPNIETAAADSYLGAAASPVELADFATAVARDHGLTMIGGCCGSTPAHIALLAAELGEMRAA